MEKISMPNGNVLYYASNWIESIAFQYVEHYDSHNDKIFCINSNIQDYEAIAKSTNKKLVMVNLEHKSPIMENGQLQFCSEYWTNAYNKMMKDYTSEIWDFQIENFEYYKFYGEQDKFRFKPLRYTTWFDRHRKEMPSKFEIQMEGVFDTHTRLEMIYNLTLEPVANIDGQYYSYGERVSLNVTNTSNSDVKFQAKNECKYGLDGPHYDSACTNNCTRIYEYVCMNKPTIVWDRDGLTSTEYFKDLCFYIKDFTAFNIKSIVVREPRKDIAESFKQMTFSDKDYDEYRLSIIKDYENRTGNKIPDTVML